MQIELLELHRRVQGRVPLPWFELNENIVRSAQRDRRTAAALPGHQDRAELTFASSSARLRT